MGGSQFVLLLIFSLHLHSWAAGNELSRCCSGGSRHFRENGNCQAVRAVGSSPTCSRAGSICCLRAVIDSSCQAGLIYAQRHKLCSTVIINELAGGIKRECCDCCLLARELSDRGEDCIAPTGFSPDCLNSFNKCCNSHIASVSNNSFRTMAVSIGVESSESDSNCEKAKCEHLCTIREDGAAQCSCRSGFDLAPDGRTCVDVDECQMQQHWLTAGGPTQALLRLLPTMAMPRGIPLCDPKREICVNTVGGFGCRPATAAGSKLGKHKTMGMRKPTATAYDGMATTTVAPFDGGGGRWGNGGQKAAAAAGGVLVNVNVKQRTTTKQRSEQAAERLQDRQQPASEAIDANSRFVYQTVGHQQLEKNGGSGRRKLGAAPTTSFGGHSNFQQQDEDECASYGRALCSEFNTQCLNSVGAFSCVCSAGFYWSDGGSVCVDIDECLLLVDDCLESQRCLNTPGGYKCIRTQSCGTGYAMDSETETCVDVDECTLGAHDCGPMYQCRNTQGSFRCVPKRCEQEDQMLDPGTGECKSVNCPLGYRAREGRCEDIDECRQQPRPCPVYEECVNTPGSFRCQEQGNVCSTGFYMDKDSGFCLDIDECQRGTHGCGSTGDCINLPGTFRCNCAAGFEFNEFTMRCEDINECTKFAGHACSLQADCINSVGSYHCICKAGFRLAADNRSCDDIDECAIGIARCQQKCINSPGSYQCICDRGYQLGLDESRCEDIDECAIWAKSGNELCMGKCINTPGSFLCTCPVGYEIMPDGITCKDIDECAQQPNLCAGEQQLCINLLGSYRCQRIECPKNYLADRQHKNRCLKRPGFCENLALDRCKKLPIHISWQHIAIPKQINISHHRTSVVLFSMKGPPSLNSSMQFELRLVGARPDFESVTPAVRANFLLQKAGEDHNSATIALRDSLDGPQEVHLELTLRLATNGEFNGKYVANLMVFVSQYRPQQHGHHQHLRNRNRPWTSF